MFSPVKPDSSSLLVMRSGCSLQGATSRGLYVVPESKELDLSWGYFSCPSENRPSAEGLPRQSDEPAVPGVGHGLG